MTIPAHFASTLRRVPVSYFVYSAFSYFGNRRGGGLPGIWFVKALRTAGRDQAGVRQTLYRMERDGELVTRREGRMKVYAPSRYAHAEIEAGTQKIFEAAERQWDGQWTFVRVGLRSRRLEKHRERVVALLAVEGFARIDGNLFVHPWQAADRLYEVLPARARADVLIVRGDLVNREGERSLVALWQLDRLAQRYRRTLRRVEELAQRIRSGVTDQEAFLIRFAVVFDYLEVAWDDPGLPVEVLPEGWPGARARRAVASTYDQLLPGATRFAGSLLEDVLRIHAQRKEAGA